jgi:hypothetical protein
VGCEHEAIGGEKGERKEEGKFVFDELASILASILSIIRMQSIFTILI